MRSASGSTLDDPACAEGQGSVCRKETHQTRSSDAAGKEVFMYFNRAALIHGSNVDATVRQAALGLGVEELFGGCEQAPRLGRGDEHPQIIARGFLPDELGERLGPQRLVRVTGLPVGGMDGVFGHSPPSP